MSEEPKQYLVAHVREALACDGRVNELDIDVTVAGGRVFLTGCVATQERKDRISAVLAERFPEYVVENEVTVSAAGAVREIEPLS